LLCRREKQEKKGKPYRQNEQYIIQENKRKFWKQNEENKGIIGTNHAK
jgi:hypothetical protein